MQKKGFFNALKLLGTYMPGSKGLPADLSKISLGNAPRICLMRHGQILEKGDKRFIGQTDLPLNAKGKAQARKWKPVFDQIGFKRIYVSGLLRTRQTAEYCCPGRAVTEDVRLNEINLGEWENLSFDQVKKEASEQFAQRGRDIYRFCTPGGESFQALKNRVLPFWEEVVSMATELPGPCLVVTHSGVIRILACVWSDIEFSRLLEFRPGYGQVLVVSKEPWITRR